MKMRRTVLVTLQMAGAFGADSTGYLSFPLWSYGIDINVGTPPQPAFVSIGTNTSDFWIVADGGFSYSEGGTYKTFAKQDSSTYATNHTPFIHILDSPRPLVKALGEWGRDIVEVDGTKLGSFDVAVADWTDGFHGSLGLGIPNAKPVLSNETDYQFLTFTQQLKSQGAIQRAAYSLDRGSLLMGAINRTRNFSDIYIMPLVPTTTNSSRVTEFAVKLSGLSALDKKGTEQPFASCAIPAILQEGIPESSIPKRLIRPFFDAIGVNQDGYFVCKDVNWRDIGLGLQIGGVEYTIKFEDLVTELKHAAYEGDNTFYCTTGINATDDGDIAIFGDNVLDGMYRVYDLESQEIGIASYNNVRHITSGAPTDTKTSIEVMSTGIPGTRASNDTQLTDGYGVVPITLDFHRNKNPISRPDTSVASDARATAKVPPSVTATLAFGNKARNGARLLSPSLVTTVLAVGVALFQL